MNIVGTVLAGGKSRRMNQDKASLIWKDKPLVEYIAELLTRTGCSQVLINRNNHITSISDNYIDSGPLAGIEACLNHLLNTSAKAELMLVMPVDMPLMTDDILHCLIQGSQDAKRAQGTQVVHFKNQQFPLLLKVEVNVLQILQELLQNPSSAKSLSIQNFLSHLNSSVLDIDEDQVSAFYNCNNQLQWQKLTSNSSLNSA